MTVEPTADATRGASESAMADRVRSLRDFKQRLFALYEVEHAALAPKGVPWRLGLSHGYRLDSWADARAATKLTGASIGDDEIKCFFDICTLTQPKLLYVIGHAFGLSTFCLALAAPEGRVVAIDDWSEGEAGTVARDLTFRIIERAGLANVFVYTGRSPGDTMDALASAGAPDRRLDLAFIDGLHTNEAARADYEGFHERLDRRSVVLWHNVHAVAPAFYGAFDELGSKLFDSHAVLFTQGPLGIFYDSREHPLIRTYLEDESLIWPDWQLVMPVLLNVAWARRQLAIRQTKPWKLARTVLQPLRRVTGTGKAARG